jgi:hypothetical protein
MKMPDDLKYEPKVTFLKKYSKYLAILGALIVIAMVWGLVSNYRAAQNTISPREQQMTSEVEMLLTLIAKPTETSIAIQRSPTPTRTVMVATPTRTPFPTRAPNTPTYAPIIATDTPGQPASGNPAPPSVPTKAPPTNVPPTSVPPTQAPQPTATDPVRPTSNP